MHAIILAAGNGDRLQPLTLDVPKPLLMLHGRHLIEHIINALVAAGITRVTVVAGYRAPQLRDALSRARVDRVPVSVIENESFHDGNASSLWAARDAAAAPFLLAMGDHLFDPEIARRLMERAEDRCRLAVECSAPGDPRATEATLVLVKDGRIDAIGKGLRDWNALDTGLFWCTPRVFDVMTPELRRGQAGAVFAELARAGELDAVDVTGLRWIDIDTPEDLRLAGNTPGITSSSRGEVA